MANLSLKNKIQLLTVLIISIIFIIIGAILIPAILEIKKLKQTIEEAKQQIESDYQKTMLLRKSISELEKIGKETEKFKQSNIIKGDELTLITTLEKIAEQNNIFQELKVNLVEKAIPTGKNNDTDEKIIFKPHYLLSFQNKGNYLDLLNYLQDIEKMPYYLIIDEMSFSKSEEKLIEQIILSFSARTYIKE